MKPLNESLTFEMFIALYVTTTKPKQNKTAKLTYLYVMFSFLYSLDINFAQS